MVPDPDTMARLFTTCGADVSLRRPVHSLKLAGAARAVLLVAVG